MMIFLEFLKSIKNSPRYVDLSLESPTKPPIFLISLDLLDFLCICKGNVKENQANRAKSRKSAVSEGNSKFKSTYLGEFLTDFKNFDIFEQEIMPSRA